MYIFDYELTQVVIDTTWKGKDPVSLEFLLRRPTLEQLLEREKKSSVEQIQQNAREDRWKIDVGPAQQRLFDAIAKQIAGYPGWDAPREATPELLAAMRGAHKEAAIDVLYRHETKVLEDESTMTFDGGEYAVEMTIGAGIDAQTVKFRLREWTEPERRKYLGDDTSINQVRGAKLSHTTIRFNLKAALTLFDACVLSVDGGTVAGKSWADADRSTFLASIDPTWKRSVIDVLKDVWQGKLQD